MIQMLKKQIEYLTFCAVIKEEGLPENVQMRGMRAMHHAQADGSCWCRCWEPEILPPPEEQVQTFVHLLTFASLWLNSHMLSFATPHWT